MTSTTLPEITLWLGIMVPLHIPVIGGRSICCGHLHYATSNLHQHQRHVELGRDMPYSEAGLGARYMSAFANGACHCVQW